jgi:hypothetical protein
VTTRIPCSVILTYTVEITTRRAREHRARRSWSSPAADEVRVRASLRGDDEDWGGYLIGPADWIGIASDTEPFFELRLPDGRIGAAFVSNFDLAGTEQRVTIAGVGTAPFG